MEMMAKLKSVCVSSLDRNGLYRGLFFLIPLIYFMSLPISSADMAVWVSMGKVIFKEGRFAFPDPFSVLPTIIRPYTVGGPILYAMLDSLGGLLLVSFFHKIALLFFLEILRRYCFENSRVDPWTPTALLLLFFVWNGLAILCVDRAAMLAVIPFIIAFHLLDSPQALDRHAWKHSASLQLIWVNLHGSWALFPAMAAWRALTRKVAREEHNARDWYLLATVLISSLLNPFGVGLFTYIWETAEISRSRNIEEWLPTTLTGRHYQQGILFCLLGLLLIVIFCFSQRRGVRWWTSPLLPLWVLGVFSVRHTVWSFAALLPFLAIRHLLPQKPLLPSSPRWLNGVCLLVVGMIAFALNPWMKPRVSPWLPASKAALFAHNTPVALVNLIHNSPLSGPVFNNAEFGSYLTYAVTNKSFFDARNIIFPDRSFETYLSIFMARPGWENKLRDFGVRWALLNETDPLAKAMLQSQDWAMVAKSKQVVLFTR